MVYVQICWLSLEQALPLRCQRLSQGKDLLDSAMMEHEQVHAVQINILVIGCVLAFQDPVDEGLVATWGDGYRMVCR